MKQPLGEKRTLFYKVKRDGYELKDQISRVYEYNQKRKKRNDAFKHWIENRKVL